MGWLGIPLLWKGILYGAQQIALWAAFIALKPYLIWILIAIAAYYGAKGGYWVAKILTEILSSLWGRLLIGCIVVFCIGGVVGFKIHPSSSKVTIKKVRLVEEKIRSRNGAIHWKGHTYYKAELINKYLEHKGLVSRFTPTLD